MSFQHKGRGRNRMPRMGGGRRGGRGMRGGFGSKRMIARIIVAGIIAISAWFAKSKSGGGQNSTHQVEGDFQVYLNASLVNHKHNDGDSFHVQHGGETVEYRLYYVDCPESKDKHYDDHKKRVKQQGRDLGGLSYQETIKLGQKAKEFTIKTLKKSPFDVFTKEESVFGSERQYAFIRLNYHGEEVWLHELLVSKGLARVHTKGIATPDGEKFKQHRAHLEKIEKSVIQQ